MKSAVQLPNVVSALLVAGLLLLPLYSDLSGNIFVLTMFTRIVIMALAAASLNLIMGYGGMMSFGHAAYLGIGGYAVGILAQEGVGSGFVQFHHDHARLRPDGLLRRLGPGALRRR